MLTESDKTFVEQLDYSEKNVDDAGTLAAEPKFAKNDGLNTGEHDPPIDG
jgi:hypothetical protein